MAASVTRRKNGKRESWYFVRTQHSPEPVLKTRSARQLARRGGFARKALAAARTGLRAQRPTDVGMITSATEEPTPSAASKPSAAIRTGLRTLRPTAVGMSKSSSAEVRSLLQKLEGCAQLLIKAQPTHVGVPRAAAVGCAASRGRRGGLVPEDRAVWRLVPSGGRLRGPLDPSILRSDQMRLWVLL